MPAATANQQEIIKQGNITLAELDDLPTFELSQLDGRLPVPIRIDGEDLDTFETKEFSGKVYERFSRAAQKPGVAWFDVFQSFFKDVVGSIGGRPLEDVLQAYNGGTDATADRFFHALDMPNAVAILMDLKCKYVGSKIQLQWQCDNCGAKNADSPSSAHDVLTADVRLLRIGNPIEIRVDLPKGLKIDGTPVTYVLMRPLKIKDARKLAKSKTDNSFILDLLIQTICGIPEVPLLRDIRGGTVFSRKHFESISSPECIESLQQAVTKIQDKVGVEIAASVECTNCGNEQEVRYPYQALGDFLFSRVK